MELIKVTEENGKQLVSARELYDFLEIKKDFTDWFKYRVGQYDFEEAKDFTTNLGKSTGGRPSKDFAITIEMAKELSMVENNEKGKEARKYFIQCEKKVKENMQQLNTSQLSPELQMFKQIFDTVAKQQLENKEIKAEIKEAKDEIQGIRDVVALEPNQWRKDTAALINKIANGLGGFEHIKVVREEAYKLLDNSYGVSLKTRLLNKQKKMALEGTPKYKIDKVNYLDVIEEDRKLINGYINIIGKLAIKYGVGGN